MSRLAKDSDSACHGRTAAEKQAYMSLPRPGVTEQLRALLSWEEEDIMHAQSTSSSHSFTPSSTVSSDIPSSENESKMEEIIQEMKGMELKSETWKFEHRLSLVLEGLQTVELLRDE